jgi:hypothetical protein
VILPTVEFSKWSLVSGFPTKTLNTVLCRTHYKPICSSLIRSTEKYLESSKDHKAIRYAISYRFMLVPSFYVQVFPPCFPLQYPQLSFLLGSKDGPIITPICNFVYFNSYSLRYQKIRRRIVARMAASIHRN